MNNTFLRSLGKFASSHTLDAPVGNELGRDVDTQLQFNPSAIITLSLGAIMVGASLFLPSLTSDRLAFIARNAQIENHPALVIGIVGAIIAGVRYCNTRSRSSAQLAVVMGLWFLGWTLFDAYSSNLHRIGCEECIVPSSVGLGVWASGIGYALIALAGLMMFFPQSGLLLVAGPSIPKEEMKDFDASEYKICPKCAEKIRAAALVCRYCHHEFPSS